MNLKESTVKGTEILMPDGRKSSPTLGLEALSSDLDHTTDQLFNSRESSPSKKSKKNYRPKRKHFCGTKQAKKILKSKVPTMANVCTNEDCQDGRTNMISRNAESEDGDDSTHSSSIPPTQAETSLGSSILEEILSEKKKALFESAEVIDFLRSHMKPS